MPKQKILITGGVGMIGKALIRILYRDYYLIVLDKKSQIKRNKKYIKSYKNKGVDFYSIDILQKKKLNKYFKNIKYVIHLANVRCKRNWKKKYNCWRVNFTGTKNDEVSVLNNVKEIIFHHPQKFTVSKNQKEK